MAKLKAAEATVEETATAAEAATAAADALTAAADAAAPLLESKENAGLKLRSLTLQVGIFRYDGKRAEAKDPEKWDRRFAKAQAIRAQYAEACKKHMELRSQADAALPDGMASLKVAKAAAAEAAAAAANAKAALDLAASEASKSAEAARKLHFSKPGRRTLRVIYKSNNYCSALAV